jgi:3-dehydroquinate synthase
MAVIPVSTAGGSYEVRVAPGLLAHAAEFCAPLLRKRDAAIVTDTNVARLWRPAIETSFAGAGMTTHWFELPAGEASKNWAQLGLLLEWLLEREVERGDAIIALGGGMVGDIVGLAASLLKRGCRFIQLPTTLLAQVDSSVGGKTAVNMGVGKNLVGAFHQPALVLADLDALDTLPPRELRAGYAEVVKYGLLGDTAFFAWCETNCAALLAGDRAAREYAVAHSVAAKARIVGEDERETTGARALLNLGHTFGHALEAQTGYSDRLLHGEGVAQGMILAARFSASRGMIPAADAERIAAHIAAADLPADLGELGLDCDGATLVAHMLHDKKMEAGSLPFVLLRGIGEAFLDRSVKLEEVEAFLDGQLR